MAWLLLCRDSFAGSVSLRSLSTQQLGRADLSRPARVPEGFGACMDLLESRKRASTSTGPLTSPAFGPARVAKTRSVEVWPRREHLHQRVCTSRHTTSAHKRRLFITFSLSQGQTWGLGRPTQTRVSHRNSRCRHLTSVSLKTASPLRAQATRRLVLPGQPNTRQLFRSGICKT